MKGWSSLLDGCPTKEMRVCRLISTLVEVGEEAVGVTLAVAHCLPWDTDRQYPCEGPRLRYAVSTEMATPTPDGLRFLV